MPDLEDRDYHAAFKSGLGVLLWPYRNQIEIREEVVLKKQGIRMDLLLIKPDSNLDINYDICRIFKTHNILEYKHPDDDLTIDVFAKVLAYANLYKSMGSKVNEIPYDKLTASIYRHTFPRELMKSLKKAGLQVERAYEGVYYISGATLFSVQIIVGKELNKKEYPMLRVLRRDVLKEDIENFSQLANIEKDTAYKDYIDKIYQVSITANRKLYGQIIKEDPKMCEALRDLMKDYIDKEIVEADVRGDRRRLESDARGMYAEGIQPDKIARIQKVSVEVVENILGIRPV